MTETTVRRVTEVYDELLAANHLDSTREAVARSADLPNLVYEGRPVCDVLRPAFLARSEHNRLMDSGRVVVAALRAAARRVVGDPALRSALRYPPGGEMAFFIDPGVEHARVWARLDGFIAADRQPRFVEFNAILPGGLSYVESLGPIFDSLPIMADLRRAFPITTVAVGSLPFDALVRSHQRSGGSGLPTLALLGEVDLADAAPDTNVVVEGIRARGIEVVVAPVDAAEWHDERLFVADRPVDVVALMPESVARFMTKFAPPHPLIDALGRGTIRILNGVASTSALASKALFAMLSDPEHGDLFDREARVILDACVPVTRVFREGSTTWRGARIDLPSFAATHREELVLKPCGELAGKGVQLGWENTASEWEAHLVAALKGKPYVIQERVEIPSITMPRSRDGALVFEPFRWSADPYVWNDEQVDALYVRMSGGRTVNIGGGGYSSAVMIVEDA